MIMVFIRYPFQCHQKCISFPTTAVSYSNLKARLSSLLQTKDFSLYCNGKKLCDCDLISNDSSVEITFSLPGGKGGFGSMLRAIGAQIEKTTNREACRDLSGRRLRDINEEQRLKRWIAKEAEREADKLRRRKERLERLKSKPKHNFVDFDFEKEISTLPERVDDALTEGIQKAKALPSKREAAEPTVLSKRKRLWMGEEMSSDSSNSDSEFPKNNSSSESNEQVSSSCENIKSKSFDPNCPGTSRQSESCSSFEIRDSEREENAVGSGDCENSNLSDACYKNKEETTAREFEESTVDSGDYENSNLSDACYKRKEETSASEFEENTVDSGDYESSNLSDTCYKNNKETKVRECEEGTVDSGDYESSNLSDACSKINKETRVREYEEGTVDSGDYENSNSLDVCYKNKEETNDSEYEESRMDSKGHKDRSCMLDSSLQNTVKKSNFKGISSSSSSLLNILPPPKEQERKDDEPIILTSYQSVSELEALGLDHLKAALIARGLKCGGNISDRAQRLWRVRGLQPHEYPTNLLAKNKK